MTCVRSTHIYCRPSCPAIVVREPNLDFVSSPAAAQARGFRACKRCRPDAAPGSPEWNTRADVAARAVRLIADGEVDRAGIDGLAARLGYSPRHLHRVVRGELGAPPVAIARAQRASTARLLLERTDLPISSVAFAAGFASVRQFNETIKTTYAATPTQLRDRPDSCADGASTITVDLAFRPPFAADAWLDHLALRCIDGVEAVCDGSYVRSLRLPHGPAAVRLTPAVDRVIAELRLSDLRDLAPAVQRCRRIADLDADPSAVDATLAADPLLAPLVAATPGLRAPGAADADEVVTRAVLGQQVSLRAARTAWSQLAARLGDPLPPECAFDGVELVFPSPEVIAQSDPSALRGPARRAATLLAANAAIASGAVPLDAGADRASTRAALMDIAGIGPWTADYVVMRALGDPDVLLSSDVAVRRGAELLGLPAAALDDHARRWSPWRSVAVHHLWRVASSHPTTDPRMAST